MKLKGNRTALSKRKVVRGALEDTMLTEVWVNVSSTIRPMTPM